MPDDFGSTGDSGGSAGTAVASPATDTSVESSPAGAPSQSTGVDSNAQAQPGPVPYDRFKQVNDGYSKLRWAETYDHDKVQQQAQFFKWLDTDPEGAFRYMEDYLTRSGSLKARQPEPQHPKPTGPQLDPNRDVVVIPETGQRFYTSDGAEKLARWTAEQLLNERLGPLEQTVQEQQGARYRAAAEAEAQETLRDADQWPHFKGHEREILAEMERDQRLTLDGAYRRVVFPKLRQLEREAIVSETKQKAGASTVNPGAVTPTTNTPVSKQSWESVFRREFNKHRG